MIGMLAHSPRPGHEPMFGDYVINGNPVLRAGFQNGNLDRDIYRAGMAFAGVPGMVERGGSPELPDSVREALTRFSGAGGEERADLSRGIEEILSAFHASHAEIERTISTASTAFPKRENLEAPARILVPVETPFRNMIPRIPGSGIAAAWKQLTSLGGGWGPNYDQPGGATATRAFYAETGAPAARSSVYADKSVTYKLLGVYWDITNLAIAAGATYQAQRAIEQRNALLNMMLNEENALINGDSAATSAPWGDGANALAFDGILNLVTTANGTPSAQVQTSVGALTQAHIDGQLRRLYNQGGRGQYILLNGIDKLSLIHLMEASGTLIRSNLNASNPQGQMGLNVTGYMHPITGESVDIIVSRFMPAGTIIFGSRSLPDGSPALQVSVLPQVELPQLAAGEQIQGYVSREIAPTTAAVDVFPSVITVYEALMCKSALHFGKSSGVTAI